MADQLISEYNFPFRIHDNGDGSYSWAVYSIGGGGGGGGVVTQPAASLLNSTVFQPTASNLNATVVGTGTFVTQSSITGTLPAFAVIPTFKIDQTTPGTTNAVSITNATLAVTQSGTWTDTVTQATAANLNAQVVGNVASAAADSGNPVKLGARVLATPVGVTDANRADLITDSFNGLWVSPKFSGTAVGFTAIANNANAQASSGTANNLKTVNFNYVQNGTSWDQMRKPNLYARVTSSAASGNPAFLKSTAGDITQWWGSCGATAAFLQLYNKASAPTIGTDTPILTYPIPASTNFTQTIPNGGGYFSTGIAYAFTTDAAGTTGSAAAAITSFALIAS